MLRTSETGERLFKAVTLKVFSVGNDKCHKRILRAGNKKGFTAEMIERILLHIASDIERQLPNEEYRLVALGPNVFNFVHAGPRTVQ